MKRLMPVVLVLGLAACSTPQVTTGTRMDNFSAHCGLEGTSIEFDGRWWIFAAPDQEAGGPPPGGDEGNTLYVEEVDGQVVVHGPDGKNWLLVEVDQPSIYDCLEGRRHNCAWKWVPGPGSLRR